MSMRKYELGLVRKRGEVQKYGAGKIRNRRPVCTIEYYSTALALAPNNKKPTRQSQAHTTSPYSQQSRLSHDHTLHHTRFFSPQSTLQLLTLFLCFIISLYAFKMFCVVFFRQFIPCPLQTNNAKCRNTIFDTALRPN